MGFVGLVCTFVLLLAVGAWLIRSHRDEMAFRRELRVAHRIEAQHQLDDYLYAIKTERARQAAWN